MIIDRPTPATQNGLENVIRGWPKWMFCKAFKKHKLCSSWSIYIYIYIYINPRVISNPPKCKRQSTRNSIALLVCNPFLKLSSAYVCCLTSLSSSEHGVFAAKSLQLLWRKEKRCFSRVQNALFVIPISRRLILHHFHQYSTLCENPTIWINLGFKWPDRWHAASSSEATVDGDAADAPSPPSGWCGNLWWRGTHWKGNPPEKKQPKSKLFWIWIEWHDLEMAPIGEFHGAKAKDKPQFIRPTNMQPILGDCMFFLVRKTYITSSHDTLNISNYP